MLSKRIEIITRDEIGKAITLPANSIICEIGVFKGDFSDILLKTFNPGLLLLIDPFEGRVISADKNGQNFETYDGWVLEMIVRRRFENNKNVLIAKQKSSYLKYFRDSHFDLIYIDGDHSELTVTEDLHNAWRLVKSGGWIAGHDYTAFPEVRKAVDEFIKQHNLKLDGLALDRCQSFFIRRP